MSEVTNTQRAHWAHVGIVAFAEQVFEDWRGELKNDPETVVSDLLCDLMHWCSESKTNFASALERARGNFTEEVIEEVGARCRARARKKGGKRA